MLPSLNFLEKRHPMNHNLIFYPHYANLTITQKSLYDLLLDKIIKAEKKISVDIDCKIEDVNAVVDAIYNDRPALYWFTGIGTTYHCNGKVNSFEPKYNSLVNDIPKHNAAIKKVISKYFAAMPSDNILKQELYFHDLLSREITYLHGSNDQNIYSAFIEKKSVCAGYTRAFQFIMNQLGIPCYYCSGLGKSDTKKDDTWERHAWNIVKLGPDYYNVDLTWDDHYGEKSSKSNHISYKYYNCTDSFISKTHKRDAEMLFLPKCNGTKYSFKNVTGIPYELRRVYDDGVSCKTLVTDSNTYHSVVTGLLKKSKGKSLAFSFPVNNTEIINNSNVLFRKAVDAVYGQSIGWHMSSLSTDYKNGYYKLKYEFTIK